MNILDELAALPPYQPGVGQCRTCQMITLEPEIGASIISAVKNQVSVAQIARVLQSHEYDISERSLQQHLKNGHQTL